jgi:hypothetical protein
VDTSLAGEISLVRSAEMAFTSEGLNLTTKLSGSSGERPDSLLGLSEVNTDKLTFAFAERSATGTIARAAQTSRALSLLNNIL